MAKEMYAKLKLYVGFEVLIHCNKDGGLYPEASR